MGIILGSGIFVAPAAVAQVVPDARGALVWLAAAAVAACGALCYAECGARLPQTGGFYVFYRRAFGEPVAFVGGWAALLITYPASMAAIAHVLASYLGEVVPGVGGFPRLTASGALVVVAALNIAGLRTGALTQRLLTSAKVGALALLCLAALALAAPATHSATAVIPTAPGATAALPGGGLTLAAVVGAMMVVLFTVDGWSDITLISGEVRDPGRNLAGAVILGVVVLAILYGLVQVAVVTVLPATRAAASEHVFAEAVRTSLGSRSGSLVSWLVVVSTFGSLHGVSLTTSRLAFAMARDGVVPAALGQLLPRTGTPARALLTICVAACVYALESGFREILTLFSFAVWIFYGLTAVALLRLRRLGVGEPVGWRAPGGPVVPGVVIATGLTMTVTIFVQGPARAAIGLGVLAAGFLVYWRWRR